MANIQLTTGSDVRDGTLDDDTFDGYAGDDGFGATGGADTLRGFAGNDLFLLNSEYSDVSGLIDGGADADTVRAYGFDLGDLEFQNVETLSVENFEFGATIAQLNAFDEITSSFATMTRIKFYLSGEGGAIDASSLIETGRSVEFSAGGLTSGYDATGTALGDVFRNSKFDDTVHGGLGDDRIYGANQDSTPGGSDLLFGDAGADSFFIRKQSGTVDGGAGVDTVFAYQFASGFGNDRLGDLGDAVFVDVERLSVGPNVTFASLAQLNSFGTITGGDTNKFIRIDLNAGPGGTIDFSSKLKLAGEAVQFRAYDATSAVTVIGSNGGDILIGSDFNDSLSGGLGNDFLGGADFVGGAMGRDTVAGGEGNDTYFVDQTDRLIELVGSGGGVDTVIATGSYDLADAVRLQGEFENLTLGGYLGAEDPSTRGFGNALDNVITGNGGSNRLDGRAGADTMIGGAGNDTFVVDDAGDVVREIDWRNDGVELVRSSVDFDLGDPNRAQGFIENLTLTGTASIDGFGNDLANKLSGNSGDNELDGRAGADTMRGFDGDDTYYVDSALDRVREALAEGIDTVVTTTSFNIGGQWIENLTMVGADNGKLTGNGLANVITGNDGDNLIRGQGGVDSMTGGGGRDKFVYNSELDGLNVGRILDFTIGEDQIRLDDAIFDTLARGRLDQDAFAFTSDGVADEADDRIVYNATTGELFYDADGSGAGAAKLFGRIGLFINDLGAEDFTVV